MARHLQKPLRKSHGASVVYTKEPLEGHDPNVPINYEEGAVGGLVFEVTDFEYVPIAPCLSDG